MFMELLYDFLAFIVFRCKISSLELVRLGSIMKKIRLTDEERLRELSRIAKLAHDFGSLEASFVVKAEANSLKSLNVEFKNSARGQTSIQEKLYLSYGL